MLEAERNPSPLLHHHPIPFVVSRHERPEKQRVVDRQEALLSHRTGEDSSAHLVTNREGTLAQGRGHSKHDFLKLF